MTLTKASWQEHITSQWVFEVLHQTLGRTTIQEVLVAFFTY